MARGGMRVGIDLEQAFMAGAQIKASRQGYELMNVAVRALPAGLVFEGEVLDVDGLAAELKDFWKTSSFSGKRFLFGVANQKVVVRVMEFPTMDEKELQAAIEFQAHESIPIPLDEAVLDFKVLSTTPDEDDGPGRQRVMVVAAQHEMIQQYVDVARKAGLDIDGIDLQACALRRSILPPVAFVDRGAPQSTDATAIVNIGTGTTNLVVAANGMGHFARVVNVGCEALVQALMASRNIEHSEADALRLSVGLTGSDAPAVDLDASVVAEIREVFDAACELFAEEILRSIDYYHSQGLEGRISTVLISGEGALTRNIAEYLTQTLHLDVQRGNALQHILENKSKIPQPELEAISPRLAIAIGLAIDDEE